MTRYPPPALLSWLFESVLPLRYQEAIFGDLFEEYRDRVQAASSSSASLWFWGQACRSVPPLLWLSLPRIEFFVSAGVAIGMYVVIHVFGYLASVLALKVTGADGNMHSALLLGLELVTVAIAGRVIARIRRGAGFILALILLADSVALLSIRGVCATVPWWYQFGFPVLAPLVVLASAVLRKSSQRPTM